MNELEHLTKEELLELLALARQRQPSDSPELPSPILDELERSSHREISAFCKKFPRDLLAYRGENWTRSGATNPQFVRTLKDKTIDTYQHVQQQYRDANRLRTVARAATEIFEDLATALDDSPTITTNHLEQTLEKCRQLAVFSFASAKMVDHEAREATAKAINLPDSLQHFNTFDDDEKDYAYSPEQMEQINTKTFERQLLRQAAGNRGGHGSRPPASNHHQYRGGKASFSNQGKQYHHQKNFFGKGPNANQQSSNPFHNSNPTHQQATPPTNQ
jgi:hypothetical protein